MARKPRKKGNRPALGPEDWEKKEPAEGDREESHDPSDYYAGEDIPATGGRMPVDAPLDQVDMSDLIDLSDSEDMEEAADHVDPHDLPDLVASTDDMAKYTDDPDILEDLADRNAYPSGTEHLMEQLKEHTSESPDLTGEDIDADWRDSRESGEESVGGSVATPEQNVTGELGEAVGIQYNDFEPLDTEDKIAERDENRWELNPESADDDETMVAYDKFKNEDQEDGDYDRVDQDFKRLMNDEETSDTGEEDEDEEDEE